MAVSLSVVNGRHGALPGAAQQARKSVETLLFLRTKK
jgi:hypothetical protein